MTYLPATRWGGCRLRERPLGPGATLAAKAQEPPTETGGVKRGAGPAVVSSAAQLCPQQQEQGDLSAPALNKTKQREEAATRGHWLRAAK